jgi:hypothetical protein
MAPKPKAEPQESDLLVPFETQSIPRPYRDYYKARRNNFFASIQGFPELWKYYILLDEIWLREIDDLERARDPAHVLPLLLYIKAHAKIRVSIELGFSGCLAEARSILRDAIEFTAHAHAMRIDEELQKTWISKDHEESTLEAFKNAFERHKKEGVFKGLEELHRTWGQLSETGSHANLNAIVDQLTLATSEKEVEYKIKYSGAEPRSWALSLFSMLLACFTMERTLFSDYEGRLKLDPDLVKMRSKFEQLKEQIRRSLIVRYHIKRPPATRRVQSP